MLCINVFLVSMVEETSFSSSIIISDSDSDSPHVSPNKKNLRKKISEDSMEMENVEEIPSPTTMNKPEALEIIDISDASEIDEM